MKKPRKHICEVVRETGKFPPDAFEFVQEGLTFAVQDTHGEMSDVQRTVHEFMFKAAGGFDELNRHVSGRCLCWGLRDYALQRWGALASAVLGHWNIRRTRDFGEIVFALVDNHYLQKQPRDRIEDFDDVYDFNEALDRAFRIDFESIESVPTSDN